jgi:hypothetical protein
MPTTLKSIPQDVYVGFAVRPPVGVLQTEGEHYNGLRNQQIQQGHPMQARYPFLSQSVVVSSCPQLELGLHRLKPMSGTENRLKPGCLAAQSPAGRCAHRLKPVSNIAGSGNLKDVQFYLAKHGDKPRRRTRCDF